MENLLDKLKILDYDTGFCVPEKMKPLTRHYFSNSGVTGDQLYYFGKLMAWLIGLNGGKFIAPDQFEDPNTIVTDVTLELKKQGIPIDFPTAKLKQGYGEEICQVLNALAQNALKAKKFKWARPAFGNEDYQEEQTVDDDIEVNTERVVEEVPEDFEDDDEHFISTEAVVRSSVKGSKEKLDEAPLESTTDANAWKLEVERVLPQLKVQIRTDNKDWRQHLEALQEHEKSLQSTSVSTSLEQLQAEITKTLEKIGSREKYINVQLEGLLNEFRSQQDSFTSQSDRYKASSTGVTELTKELTKLSEELESLKSQTDERGANMTNPEPVVKIKQALNKMKADMTQMDLRIGVLQHTLLSAKLRSKVNMIRDMHEVAPAVDTY